MLIRIHQNHYVNPDLITHISGSQSGTTITLVATHGGHGRPHGSSESNTLFIKDMTPTMIVNEINKGKNQNG